jgi:hypothetical protein
MMEQHPHLVEGSEFHSYHLSQSASTQSPTQPCRSCSCRGCRRCRACLRSPGLRGWHDLDLLVADVWPDSRLGLLTSLDTGQLAGMICLSARYWPKDMPDSRVRRQCEESSRGTSMVDDLALDRNAQAGAKGRRVIVQAGRAPVRAVLARPRAGPATGCHTFGHTFRRPPTTSIGERRPPWRSQAGQGASAGRTALCRPVLCTRRHC